MQRYRSVIDLAVATAILIACVSLCAAQCTVLVQDTFQLGLRPHGGHGDLRDAQVHDNLSGYWPQAPTGVQWIATNVSGQPGWIFAASSLDPAESNETPPFNGTAFCEGGHQTALLPFSPPGGAAITLSAEVALPLGIAASGRIGFTSNSATSDNFDTFGALWLSFDGLQHWTVYANGLTPIGSGTFNVGVLSSGWTRMELGYDPVTSTASGNFGGTAFGPTPVSLGVPISHFAMEGHDLWFVVNNLVVRTGAAPTVTITGPTQACAGSTMTLSAATDAAAPANVQWLLNGVMLSDGPLGSAQVSGANSLSLTITGVTSGSVGSFDCIVANVCGFVGSAAPHAVTFCSPCTGDANGDRKVDESDLGILLSAFDLTVGQPGYAAAADFDGSGRVDPSDLGVLLAAFGTICP
ncbi:MAG: hypothetical protein U1D55_06125 [Phycisphaerae bacterium]